ncbi:MAG: hypothetical protein Tsb0033_27940 [Winogradskyella sp.]|nr:hypothetical protein [Flavobacteriaceae bacterium]|tara:strand:+ start:1565 stop:1801 length:237 start_codon:yes stop_codon:yes gene_type:complete
MGKVYKNVSFNENYSPKWDEFKKSHSHIIPLDELEEAYKALTGKDITKKQKTALQKEINGNTSTATSESSEANANASE